METFSALVPIVREIHRSPVNSPHKSQGRGPLMLSLICACMNDRVNDREADDLRRHRAHYDVTVMCECDNLFHHIETYFSCICINEQVRHSFGHWNGACF